MKNVGFKRHYQKSKKTKKMGENIFKSYIDLWTRKIPWRRKWQPTLLSLPGKSHGQRSLAGYSPWSHKELDTMEELNDDNKKIAHSYNGIQAWKEGNTDTCYKEEAWKHYAKWRKPQNTSCCMVHLHEMSRIGKSTETESISVVARGLGEKEMEWLLMGMGFIWGGRNCSGIRQLCCFFEYTKNHWIIYLKGVDLMICVVFLLLQE